MGTRHVVDASDEPDFVTETLPETYVSHITVVSESKEQDADPFYQPASELNGMDGTGTVFKRKVSRQINKVRRGQEDAESKAIEEEAEYTGYQMFDVIIPPYNLEYLAKLYHISPIHQSAVDAKVSNIVGLGYHLEESARTKRLFERNAGDKEKTKKARQRLEKHRDEMLEALEEFNEEDTLTEVFKKVWTDYETMGNGYLEIGRKRDGTVGYIGHIPAQTMRVRKKRDGFVQISAYKLQFFANLGDNHDRQTGEYDPMTNPIGGGVPNEVIHIKKYSPNNGYYGIPNIVSAQQAVAGNEFAARFNLDYFENKAIPRHLIIMKGATLGAGHEEKLLKFFETGLKGQNHRSLFIPLPADTADEKRDFKIEPIEADTQDSSFEKYKKQNMNEILMAHRVPISKIGLAEGVSLAVARDADKTFKEQVCAPEQQVFEKKVNRVIRELTDALDLKLNEMTLTDEDTQSKIDERDRKAGIKTSNEVRASRGMPAIEGGDELVDLNAKDKAAQRQAELTTQRERDSRRSAGATDSAGEARSPQGEGRSAE